MKTRFKLLSLLWLSAVVITISSCTSQSSAKEKNIDVFDLDILNDGGDRDAIKVGQIKALFKEDQGYIPYVSLKQYASLFAPHFDSSIDSSVTKRNNLITWTVSNEDGMFFITQIDTSAERILYGGSLEPSFKQGDDPVDTAALIYAANTTYDGDYLGQSPYATCSYKDLGIETIDYKGDVYFPLSLFDTTFSFDAGIYFFYNYHGIYSTHNVDDYYLKTFKANGKTYTVNKEMASLTTDDVMPNYLKEYNANMFMYLLDNFYGLKGYKGIKTAKEYCQQIGTYDALFDNDNQKRVQAYANTLAKLDDNHTALVAGSEAWGEQAFERRKYGQGCIDRSNLMSSLTNLRKSCMDSSYYEANNEPVFSSDGKTAMFFFDSFVYGTSEQVFNNDGSIKDTAHLYDSFFSLLKLFKDLQAKGGVENVILDMSTNGGGVLGVLMKLLALISKDNVGSLYYYEAASKQVGIATTQIDVDGNGIYNSIDCFGDDFNIYLLTSDCSFSCGNAFPCLAKRSGAAKIIGQKSGGGECAVGIHYLPNGEYVYHSSNLHIGYFDARSRVFTGFEDGAEPDIKIDNYNDFYNIDRLASYFSA